MEEVSEFNLIADDLTPEALGGLLKKNEERLGIVSAEGGIFGMLSGRYNKQPNIDLFLKAYPGEPYSTSRIGRDGETLSNPLLTMLLMVQPIVLHDAINNLSFMERGLMARFLYSLPKSKVGSRRYETAPIDPKTRTAYADIIETALSRPRRPQCEENTIRLSPEAERIFRDFCNNVEARLVDDLDVISNWTGKFPGQVLRIAGNLHCVECGGFEPAIYKVTPGTMHNAIRIGNYFLQNALAVFTMSTAAESEADKCAKYILRRIINDPNIRRELDNDGQISMGIFLRACQKNKYRHREDLQPGLDELKRRHYLKTKRQSVGRGRPSEVIVLNPDFQFEV